MDEGRLIALLEAYLETRLTDLEQEELENLLLESPEARRVFWQYAHEHAALVELMGEARGLRLAKEGERPSPAASVGRAGTGRATGPRRAAPGARGNSGPPRTILWGLAASLVGVALFAGLFLSRGPAEGPAEPDGARGPTVEAVEGEVFRTRPRGPREAVRVRERVPEADLLETAGAHSRLILAFDDGTRLTLEERSLLKGLGGGGATGKRMHLDRGALRLSVAPQPKDRPLVVSTPQGSARVVGTIFRLLVDSESGGRTRLEVEEGKVRLSRRDGASVEVSGGSYAVAASGVDLVALPLTLRPPPGTWTNLMDSFSPPVSLDPDDFKNQNYGMQTLAVCASRPTVLYIGTCYQGIYKSVDGGDHWIRVNTGANGPNLNTGRNWTLAVDPTDPDVVYTVAGAGLGQGLWKSTNGGVDWVQMLSASMMQSATADVYCITIDPSNPLHLILGFHSGWNQGSDAGVLESPDGGSTWVPHPPRAGWGAGHYVFFIDSATWILATEGNGFWRTSDSGREWIQVVSQYHMQHGADQMYRAANGALYLGAVGHLLRSTDQGRSWSPVALPPTADGYNAVVGDGTYLYAQAANTGAASGRPTPYFVSLETDGLTWISQNGQIFSDGPMSLGVGGDARIIYSSNWRAGVWRLVRPR